MLKNKEDADVSNRQFFLALDASTLRSLASLTVAVCLMVRLVSLLCMLVLTIVLHIDLTSFIVYNEFLIPATSVTLYTQACPKGV